MTLLASEMPRNLLLARLQTTMTPALSTAIETGPLKALVKRPPLASLAAPLPARRAIDPAVVLTT